MADFLDDLMVRLFIESNFSLAKIDYIDESYELSTSIYIAHKPFSDYFIYIRLPERLLPYITNDIQIKITSRIKAEPRFFHCLNGGVINIAPSFDKNSTLIIFTDQNDSDDQSISRQAISIEEDPYFFKKQVLVTTNHNFEYISTSFYEHQDNYIKFLQEIISNTEIFNDLMNSKGPNLSINASQYSFTAKLYEKLPFLVLSAKKSHPGDLQKKIDDKLSNEQQEQCNEFLELDLNKLQGWFDEVLKEESDA